MVKMILTLTQSQTIFFSFNEGKTSQLWPQLRLTQYTSGRAASHPESRFSTRDQNTMAAVHLDSMGHVQ